MHPYAFFTQEAASHSPALLLATEEPLEQGRMLDGDAKHSHTPAGNRTIEYPDMARGFSFVDVTPHDPIGDPIRDSDVPVRAAMQPFHAYSEPWAEEVRGFMEEDRPLVPMVIDMPNGVAWPSDEHRPLTDGSHG